MLTIDIMNRLGEAIQVVALGGPVSTELAHEVYLINTCPLDESAGEGYHRSSNITRLHCPGAMSPYIKQSCRLEENLSQVKSFMSKFKHEGRQVLRFEWQNYMRILQTRPNHGFTPVKMKPKAFFERVYRMDEKAKEDWAFYLLKIKPCGVIVPKAEQETWHQELAREYLLGCFACLCYYSVPTSTEKIDESGSLVQEDKLMFFQVLKMNYGSSRTKVIPTVESLTDTAVVKKLAAG